ncbi:hypothetical protein [Anaeromyxobacter paludicola]|uniref:Lipoprotein n=1 Tax=Anaeromyxobacter paludicola TaxID=2918171 RepID=A0ABM7X7Q7_9BACT|nr:hypothetical protein [Anaeromyxobacter paludicola]BDG07866.1 hypothetical protein AMPC_09790 [Anaeromyxobacter paludicola]
MRRLAAVTAAVVLASCAGRRGPPSGAPSRDQGMLTYGVGALSFEAPADWRAQGEARRFTLLRPDERAKLDVQQVERTFGSEKECLADAEAALARGSGGLQNMRRHPTTFAGRRALLQEADAGQWHGWAWAVCAGPHQYRLFLTGQSPLGADVLRAQKLLLTTARVGGGS